MINLSAVFKVLDNWTPVDRGDIQNWSLKSSAILLCFNGTMRAWPSPRWGRSATKCIGRIELVSIVLGVQLNSRNDRLFDWRDLFICFRLLFISRTRLSRRSASEKSLTDSRSRFWFALFDWTSYGFIRNELDHTLKPFFVLHFVFCPITIFSTAISFSPTPLLWSCPAPLLLLKNYTFTFRTDGNCQSQDLSHILLNAQFAKNCKKIDWKIFDWIKKLLINQFHLLVSIKWFLYRLDANFWKLSLTCLVRSWFYSRFVAWHSAQVKKKSFSCRPGNQNFFRFGRH